MTLKSLVSLVCRVIARDACRTDRQTDRQTDADTQTAAHARPGLIVSAEAIYSRVKYVVHAFVLIRLTLCKHFQLSYIAIHTVAVQCLLNSLI